MTPKQWADAAEKVNAQADSVLGDPSRETVHEQYASMIDKQAKLENDGK